MLTVAQPKGTKKVLVTRSFWHEGKAVPIGTEIEVPIVLAYELRGANKAEFVEAEEPPKASGVSEKVKADFITGKDKKGK